MIYRNGAMSIINCYKTDVSQLVPYFVCNEKLNAYRNISAQGKNDLKNQRRNSS